MLRANKINLYIRVMENLGISQEKLLANTFVDVDSLFDSTYSISQSMYHAVIFNMLELSNNSGVSFSVGRELNFGDLGFAGYAIMASSNIEKAMEIRQNYSQAYFGTKIKINSYKTKEQGYILTISSNSPTDRLKQFEIEEYFSTGFNLIEKLLNKRPEVESVSFTYPKPTYYYEYEKLFNCPITFGAEKTEIKMAYPSLDTPIISKNEELFEICTKHCQKIMATSGEENIVREQLCDLFLSTPRNLPDLKTAASSLALSARSLRRKLKENNTSYEALKAEFRLDLTRQLLFEAKMTPKQISYFLGYQSPSSFSRAFKSWTGQTIKKFSTNNPVINSI